jgi:glycosyltransferase involved in cell wall biosynthesis
MDGIQDPGLKQAVRHLGPKTLEQIVLAVRECDIGVIPNRRSIFTELNTPTRIFEYLSQGKSVVAPRAPGILDYFGPDDLIYFDLGDVEDLAEKLVFAALNPAAVAATIKRGQAVYQTHLWSNEKHRFMDAVAQTLGLGTSAVNEVGREGAVPIQVGK